MAEKADTVSLIAEPTTDPPDLGPDPTGISQAMPSLVGRAAIYTLRQYGLVLVLVGLVAGFYAAMPNLFLSLGNISTMLGTQTVVLTLSLALLFPLTVGEFDLSISANMVFAAGIVTLLINDAHWNAMLAVLAGIVCTSMVGMINGILVVVVGLNGFITTLGTMTLLSAGVLGVTNQNSILVNTNTLTNTTSQSLFGIPIDCYYVWILALATLYVLERTPLGRHLRVTGTARDAGRLIGLQTDRLRIAAYIACGAIVGFASYLLLGNIGSIDPSTSGEYLLEPYAAAFLGSAVIKLGRFNVIGVLVAVYIVVVGSTGLELLGLSSWIGDMFQGALLLMGLLLARWMSGHKQVVIGQTG